MPTRDPRELCEGCRRPRPRSVPSPPLCPTCEGLRNDAALAVWPYLIERVIVDLKDFPEKDALDEVRKTACFAWHLADAFTRGQKP